MSGNTPRRAPGDGGLSVRHRCGKKHDGTWPCGKAAAKDCPKKLWVGTLNLGIGGDGKRHTKYVYARSRNDAARKLRDAQRDLEAGVSPKSTRTTVSAWLDYWLAEIARHRQRPNTWRGTRSLVNRHLAPNLGAHQIDRLTAAHVRTMLTTVQTTRSTSTAAHAYNTLNVALRDAVREGVVSRNVAELVDRPAVVHEARPSLPMEDARALVRHLVDSPDPLASRWIAALLLGARPGELLGLTWDRVNLDDLPVADLAWQLRELPMRHGCGPARQDGTYPCGKAPNRPRYCPDSQIDAPPGYPFTRLDPRRALCLVPTKTDTSRRVVPLPGILASKLRELRDRGPRGRHSLVWTTPEGDPLSPQRDGRAWRAVCRDAGLQEVTLYAARHTTATLLMGMHVEEHVRMQIMGQSSAAAHRGYAHVDTTMTRRALSGLGDALTIESGE